jgi:hypothetical protein
MFAWWFARETVAAEQGPAQERPRRHSFGTDIRRVAWEVAADGALRPQDRSYFETWNQPNRLPDL